MSAIRSCLIVGVNGQFGRIFAKKLSALGVAVGGIDQQAQPAEPAFCSTYFSDVLPSPKPVTRTAIENADYILQCTPESAVLAAMPFLCEVAKDDAVLMDIASVKTNVAKAYGSLARKRAYLSIHPMFGPMEDFSGRPMAVVALKESTETSRFLALMENWRPELVPVSADEHDAITACIQVLPHAALIALGLTLKESGASFENMLKLSTPVNKLVLTLLSRIDGSATYWSIQASNPNGQRFRDSLKANLEKLSAIVGAGDAARFTAELDAIANYLGPARPDLLSLAERAVALTRHPPR